MTDVKFKDAWRGLSWRQRIQSLVETAVYLGVILATTRALAYTYDLHAFWEVVLFFMVFTCVTKALEFKHGVKMEQLDKRHAELLQERKELEAMLEEGRQILAAVKTYRHREMPRA